MAIDKPDPDKAGKIPVFRQIYLTLFDEIKDGLYDKADKLPSEKDLCLRFNVERNTVRKALQILVAEKKIIRIPGIGTKLIRDPAAPGPVKEISKKGSWAQEKNNIILLVAQVDYLHSPNRESFHYKLIANFEKQLSRLGYNLLFKPTGRNGLATDAIRGAMPRGIIFDSYHPDSYYREATGLGLPCVSVNHYTPLFTSIVSNNFEGACNVAGKLVDSGHERIAFVTGKNNHQTNIERLNGIQALYNSRGLSLKGEYIIPGDWTFSSGGEAAKKILNMKAAVRPTAIFAFNDDLAYGCYNTLRSHGLSVPEDMSLVGFDKSDRYLDMFPPITTVDVNIEAIVNYACWYLGSSLLGQSPAERAKIQIDTTICDNGTVKILP